MITLLQIADDKRVTAANVAHLLDKTFIATRESCKSQTENLFFW